MGGLGWGGWKREGEGEGTEGDAEGEKETFSGLGAH